MELFRSQSRKLQLSLDQATGIGTSYFDARHWISLMITALCRREFRDAASLVPDIGTAAAALADLEPRAHWQPNLTRVLDDEPVVAIDHATSRGFHLTMSCVENFQLHTLLADRGEQREGLLAHEPPLAE